MPHHASHPTVLRDGARRPLRGTLPRLLSGLVAAGLVLSAPGTLLASGRADALAGRYIHAEHDDIEDLIARADEIESKGLNAIRLQR